MNDPWPAVQGGSCQKGLGTPSMGLPAWTDYWYVPTYDFSLSLRVGANPWLCLKPQELCGPFLDSVGYGHGALVNRQCIGGCGRPRTLLSLLATSLLGFKWKVEKQTTPHVLPNKFYLTFLPRKDRHMLVEKMLQQNKILVRIFIISSSQWFLKSI